MRVSLTVCPGARDQQTETGQGVGLANSTCVPLLSPVHEFCAHPTVSTPRIAPVRKLAEQALSAVNPSPSPPVPCQPRGPTGLWQKPNALMDLHGPIPPHPVLPSTNGLPPPLACPASLPLPPCLLFLHPSCALCPASSTPTGSLGAAVLKPLVAALSSRALPLPLSLRLLDVATARLAADTAGGGADAALAASWLLSVLFGPQHGNTVLSPDGVDLTPEWRQQRAVVDAAVEAVVGRLGGAAGLLQVLAPQLLQLPLTDVGTAGCGAARVQRYSLVRLCGACAAGGDGQGPGELAGVLPRAVALCGLELGVAAAQQQQPQGFAGVGAGGAEVGGSGPVLQLLCECPGLVVPVARCLGELVAGHGGKGAVGSLPMNLAAMAGLRLVQAAVRAQGVRAALVGSRGEVVEAAGGLVRAVRELPAAAGAAAGGALVGGDGTSCVVEAGRLEQMVADLYGAGVAAGGQQ